MVADGQRRGGPRRGRRRPLLVGRFGARVPRLPRHRVGLPGRRRRAAVREAQPRGVPGRPVVADDPAQAGGVPEAFADFDFEQVAEFGEGDVARLLATRDRPPPRQDRGGHQQRAARARAGRAGGLAGALHVELRAAGREPAHRAALAEPPATDESRALPASSSGGAGGSSARRRSTRSCRRWVWSTTTSPVATPESGLSWRARSSPGHRRRPWGGGTGTMTRVITRKRGCADRGVVYLFARGRVRERRIDRADRGGGTRARLQADRARGHGANRPAATNRPSPRRRPTPRPLASRG